MKKFLVYILLTFLTACYSYKPYSKNAYSENVDSASRDACQIITPNHSYYAFSAKVIDKKRIIRKQYGGLNKVTTTRLVSTITKVRKGNLKVNQSIFIDLATQNKSCRVRQTCSFVAPKTKNFNKSKGLFLLSDAMIIPQ